MTAYEKINKWLMQHESGKYSERSLDSVADYIDWAWKWRKISREEMESSVDRICALFDADVEKP